MTKSRVIGFQIIDFIFGEFHSLLDCATAYIFNDFIQRTNVIFIKLKQKGYVPQKICCSIRKCISRNPWITTKYTVAQKYLIFKVRNI